MDNNTKIEPLVSVNICTYNRAKLLSKALDSVLKQTYQNMEIIVLDDHSEDNTEDVVKEYDDIRIKYVRNDTNLGVTGNRNNGLKISTGKYIAVLDSDDYWIEEDKIEKQVEFLENNPEYALVGTGTNFVNDGGKILKTFSPKISDMDIKNKLLLTNQFIHSSVMFRKDKLNKYPTKYSIWEDYALILELGRNNKLKNLSNVTTNYLVHNYNISKKNKRNNIKTLGTIIRDNRKYYPGYIPAKIKNMIRLIFS